MTQPPGYGPHGEHPEYLPPEPTPAPPPAWSDAAETAVLPPVPPYPAWSSPAPPAQSAQPQQAPWDWQALSGHDLHGPPDTPAPDWHQGGPGHPTPPSGATHDPLPQAAPPDTSWPTAPYPGPTLNWHQQQAPAEAPPQAAHPDATPGWHQQAAPQAPADAPHANLDWHPQPAPQAPGGQPHAPHRGASPDWQQHQAAPQAPAGEPHRTDPESAPFAPQAPHAGPTLDWHHQQAAPQAPAGAPRAPHPDAAPDWAPQPAPGDQSQRTAPDSTSPNAPFSPHAGTSPEWHPQAAPQAPDAGWGGVAGAPGADAQRPAPRGRRRRAGQQDDWPGTSAEAGPQAAAAAAGALFRNETPSPPQAPAGPDSAAFAAHAPADGHRHAAPPVGGPWYPGATDPNEPVPSPDWPAERESVAPPPAADRTVPPPPSQPPAAWPEPPATPAPEAAPRYSGHPEAPYPAAPSAAAADPTSSAARRALGGSPIIDPGPEAAAITMAGALALAFAAMGPRPLLGLVGAALQALTAAGWFRLNGMWPARQGIALAALGGFTASAAAPALSGTSGAAAALTGTLGGFFALVLVLQLVRPADPAERFSALTVTASATVTAVLGAGWLAAAPLHASGAVVTVGALSAGLATLVAAGARFGPSAAMVAGFVAALVAGGAAGSLTGLGATAGVALGAAAGGAALVGRRVAAYDFPSRFVHLTAGVALPLALAAPATFLVGLLVG